MGGPRPQASTVAQDASRGLAALAAAIVIPNRNYGHFAVQAVESVLHQTHPGVECIVVDYGSTDDSVAKLSRYPIRLLTAPEGDLASAFDRGVKEAKAPLVAMLGADDVLHPAFVERSLAAFVKHPKASWVYPGGYLFGPGAPPPGGRRILAPPFSRGRLRRHNYILATALVRREALLRHGSYGSGVPFEDWDLWLRLSEAGLRGVPLDEPLLHYRQHSPTQRNNVPKVTYDQARDQVLVRNLGHPMRRGPVADLVRGARWRVREALGDWSVRNPTAARRVVRLPGAARLRGFWWLPCPAQEADPAYDFLRPEHSCAQEGAARRA